MPHELSAEQIKVLMKPIIQMMSKNLMASFPGQQTMNLRARIIKEKDEASGSAEDEDSGNKNYVLLKNSKLRAEPNGKRTLMSLRKGSSLEMLDIKGNWCKVKIPSGETGWINRSVIKETPKTE